MSRRDRISEFLDFLCEIIDVPHECLALAPLSLYLTIPHTKETHRQGQSSNYCAALNHLAVRAVRERHITEVCFLQLLCSTNNPARLASH